MYIMPDVEAEPQAVRSITFQQFVQDLQLICEGKWREPEIQVRQPVRKDPFNPITFKQIPNYEKT